MGIARDLVASSCHVDREMEHRYFCACHAPAKTHVLNNMQRTRSCLTSYAHSAANEDRPRFVEVRLVNRRGAWHIVGWRGTRGRRSVGVGFRQSKPCNVGPKSYLRNVAQRGANVSHY